MAKKRSPEEAKKYWEKVSEYYRVLQKVKNLTKKYEDRKAQFMVDMDEAFSGSEQSLVFRNPAGQEIRVTRASKTQIEWDIGKLRKRIPKKKVNKILDKVYTINNMPMLTSYLRQCGVDPDAFKSFITVDEKVSTVKLNELSELGELRPEDIQGCYTVNQGNIYYKLTMKERGNEE